MHQDLQQVHDQFVERMGFLGTLFGFSKLVGQIYGVLYLSPHPKSLNELLEILQVSKASISTNIRELEKWGGCKKVWIKGDRKDYYQAEINFKAIFNKRLFDALKRRVQTVSSMTDEAKQTLSNPTTLDKKQMELFKFIKARLEKIERNKKKFELIVNTLTKLL